MNLSHINIKQSFSAVNSPLIDPVISILCLSLLLCQVPALGVGLSTAAVGSIYKCPRRPGVVYLQATYTLHVCVHMCVFKRAIRILRRGQS